MVMDIIWDMLTMDTTDTHMLTMDITMARDLLMLSQRPRLMGMLTMDTMDMLPTHTPMDMLTMDTMDTHMLTTHTLTMARDLLMLSQRPSDADAYYGYYGYAAHPYAYGHYGYAHHGYYGYA